jgi:eukaryotic-like serine/threonine-protein kinase
LDVANEFERLKLALAQRYRLDREVGRGGMATVYRAHDLRHDRPVAIKVLKPELAAALGAERFLREITLTARLDHPHILPLLDSGEAEGFLYYVMPYVEGESLRDRLNRERQLPLDDALQIVREVADALSHAHRLGIVHRDIKPENILLSAGHARVADFGIARAVEAAGGETVIRLTATGIAAGTPLYMSPEQANGERDVDARTDVYSLACVLYETLAGQPPYTGATAAAILALKSLEAVPRLRVVRDAVPTGVEEAITKGLARIPADRFGTPSQFAEALERGRAVMTPVAPVSHRVPRRRLLLPTAATLVLVIAGAWWVTQREPQSTAITSLAVLPLKNLMGDPAQDYFVEGMHEALTAELSKIGALKVISRTSAMRYRGTDKPMPQIARELGVEGLIESSVLREGDQVRITVQLIHGPSDRYLWAQSFDRELRGILALHSDVARAIAGEIRIAITPAEEARLAHARPANPEAYEAYLKGISHFSRIHEGLKPLKALEYFQQAIDIDPSYAPAYVALADSYNLLAIHGERLPREVYPLAKAALLKALDLDETLADAHALLGVVNFRFDWDWQGAERELQRALQIEPNSARAHLAYGAYSRVMDRVEEHMAHFRRHQELDPLSPRANLHLAWALHRGGRYDEAIARLYRVLELQPGDAWAYVDLASNYAAKKMYTEAIAACEKASGLMPEDDVVLSGCGQVYGLSGRHRDAAMAFEKLTSLSARRYVDPFKVALVAAVIYSDARERDPIFDWLERAYVERSARLCTLKVEPAFDNLRSDPRFQELLRRMNLPS